MAQQAIFNPPLQVKADGYNALLFAVDGGDVWVQREPIDTAPHWTPVYTITVDVATMLAIRQATHP